MAPSIYRSYLPAFFDHEAPREEKATCGSCVMLPPKDEPRPLGITYFLPETKCCTFHPTLPNYLVGAALADARPEMEEGKRRLRGRIASRVAVSPRWLAAPRKFDLLLKGSWTNTMGRSLMMRCPLYSPDHGGRTISPHSEGVCATFFCKYKAAAAGQAFWRSILMYPSRVQLFYFPLDFTWAVAQTLTTLQPSLLVLGELELWPNLIDDCRRRGVPVAVINGRLSPRSFASYRRLSWLTRGMFTKLSLVAAQSQANAQRFQACGATANTIVTGSIKFDNVAFDRHSPEIEQLRELVGIGNTQRMWVMWSTQVRGELPAVEA